MLPIEYPVGITRCTLQVKDARAKGIELPHLRKGQIAIVSDRNDSLGHELVKQLSEHGCHAVLCNEPPGDSNVVISLVAWKNFADQDSAIQSNLRNFSIAKKIAPRFSEQGGSFVILQDTGGTFGINYSDSIRAWSGGASGLIKTAAQEWPKATLKIIDLPRSTQSATILCLQLINELFSGGDEIEIGFSLDGRRITLETTENKNVGNHFQVLSPSSVLIVSGGARGVTAACLIELAKQFQPQLVLLGRTPLEEERKEYIFAQTENELKNILVQEDKKQNIPLNFPAIQKKAKQILSSREVLETIQALQKAGSKVEYKICDVQNKEELKNIIAQIHQQYGKVTGIIHGAGILADKFIKDKTIEQFLDVFNTKVKGLIALLEATKTEPLSLIALFSSVAARFGNKGQCDYAMANEILNKVAQTEQQQRGENCLVKSLNWGPWAGGMVSDSLKKHFNEMHIQLLPIDIGAKMFVNELTHFAKEQVEIILGSTFPSPPSNSAISMKFEVSQKTHGFLLDHAVKDMPVLPLCIVLNWFLCIAKKYYPNHSINIIENIKVLKGIRLDHFEKGHTFIVEGIERQEENCTYLKLQLHAKEKVIYYSAHVPLLHEPPSIPRTISLPLGNAWPWTIKEIYEKNILFHGPSFQVLQSNENFSALGGTGVTKGIHAISQLYPDWLHEPWMIDGAALDGGLQLALVWSFSIIGKSLPMFIKKFIIYESTFISEPIQIVLKVQSTVTKRATFYIQYKLSTSEKLIAEIEGLEVIGF